MSVPHDDSLPDGDLPARTLTFLFTDIQGSTKLWERHPDAMRAALARHDALLRAGLEAHGGHVFKTAGDAFHAAFGQPGQALAAALRAQVALHAEPWPLPEGEGLRVRMALHAGEAEARGGDYFGAPLSRTARLLNAAHGGQTLLSEAFAALAEGALAPDVSLRSLGRHRLKDLAEPQEVFQLVHPLLPDAFPPLRSLESFTHNIPSQLSSFIGRTQEMREARRLLAGTRLLTLTGTGGAGKTRLALQVAAEVIEDYADGVWLVDFAPLTDPSLLAQAVASVLGIGEEGGSRSLAATLADALRAKSVLLVWDNCEHLVGGCARLAESLLRSCPGLRLLATSREALEIGGEAVLPVPSLALPPVSTRAGARAATPEALADCDSVRLFVERATTALPAFRLSDGNAPAVAQVCARLDGIPLALELAAARVRVLTPEQIAARLDDRFRLLSGGSRTALPRQQTLRALIDWSYDLLPPAEKALLRRLSVFAGGWTLEAAESVCVGEEVDEWEVLDLLSRLVAKSLVVVEPPDGGHVRYRLLENLRSYARERLGETGEGDALAARHRDWFLGFAELAEPNLSGPEQASWLDRLERDHDNLRAALAYCRSAVEPEQGLRLAGALAPFWAVRSYLSEGLGWLEKALALAPNAPLPVQAKALGGAGRLFWSSGDFDKAQSFHARDLALRRTLGDKKGIARALANLGILASERRDFAQARPLFEESLAFYREIGDSQSAARMLNNLASMIGDAGDHAGAVTILQECLTTFYALQDLRGIATTLHNLGEHSLHQSLYPQAAHFFRESLRAQKSLGDRQRIASTLNHLGFIACRQEDHERSYLLLALADVLMRTAGVAILTLEAAQREEYMLRLSAALDPKKMAALQQAADGMSHDQAMNFALL